MSMLIQRIRNKGFTLIELLVVIAIIATLAAILTPIVSKALLRGQVTQTINNGYNLYRLLFFEELDNPLGLQSSGTTVNWPSDEDDIKWTDSSHFFGMMVTNENFDLNYAFFAAPGMSAAKDSGEWSGSTLRNIWCIAMEVTSGVKFGSPVLFTQNIDFSALTVDKMEGLIGDEASEPNAKPYGGKAAIAVQYGGSAFSMDASTATATNFNPAGAANEFLKPLNSDITATAN